MLSSFLYSIILAGVFAAVAELLVPARFYTVGRLLRAVICVVLVSLLVSPVLSFLLGEEWREADLNVEPEAEHESELAVFEITRDYTVRLLRENLQSYASSRLGECRVELLGTEDINSLTFCIYSDKDAKEVEAVCEEIFAIYSIAGEGKKHA